MFHTKLQRLGLSTGKKGRRPRGEGGLIPGPPQHAPQHLVAQLWYSPDLKGQLCFDAPEFQTGPPSPWVSPSIPKDVGPSLVCSLIPATRIVSYPVNEFSTSHLTPFCFILDPWTHLSRCFSSLHSEVRWTQGFPCPSPTTSPWASGPVC